jgi:hypothetical protein
MEVFKYLTRNYNYLLLKNFQEFRKRFEKNPELFESLFHEKTLAEIQKLRLDIVFPVFTTIWNGSNIQLKKIITPIIDNTICEVEELTKSIPSSDYRNIIMFEQQFRYI